MIDSDRKALEELKATLSQSWTIHSVLPFLTDGQVAGVFVGTRQGDERYYVFRAYSFIKKGGVEMDTRHDDLDKAIAARQKAAQGHADEILS